MYDAEIGTLRQESYSDFLNNFQVEWRLWNSLILRGRVMLSFKRNNGDEFLPAAHSSFASITKDSPVEEQLRKGSYLSLIHIFYHSFYCLYVLSCKLKLSKSQVQIYEM